MDRFYERKRAPKAPRNRLCKREPTGRFPFREGSSSCPPPCASVSPPFKPASARRRPQPIPSNPSARGSPLALLGPASKVSSPRRQKESDPAGVPKKFDPTSSQKHAPRQAWCAIFPEPARRNLGVVAGRLDARGQIGSLPHIAPCRAPTPPTKPEKIPQGPTRGAPDFSTK